jgi:hypothetical protein
MMLQTLRKWAKPKYPWKIWAIPFLLISPAAFLIPNDVFTQYPWASTPTNWVAAVVPMIDRTAHLHPHPDKFRAFYAYVWCWLPWCFFLVGIELKEKAKTTGGVKLHLMKQPVVGFCGFMIFVWGMYLLYVSPGDGGFKLSLLTRSDPRAHFYSHDFYLVWIAPILIYVFAFMSIGTFQISQAFFALSCGHTQHAVTDLTDQKDTL